MTPLKPCPFCGYPPLEHDIISSGAGYDAPYFSFAVWCECGIRTAPWRTKREAIRNWNRRIKPKQPHEKKKTTAA